MAKGNNTLLIFDFDNTITNGHMHNALSRLSKSDFNSTQNNAATDNDIKNFLENTDGIKNKEGLKSVLQSALSSGIEVNIASYTKYPDAVKEVVKDHLGLFEEQTGSISVFGGFPGDYDNQLQELDVREQQSQVGKNLHICEAIVKYKNKHGELPKTVMLVDDDVKNIQKINEFVASMSKRGGWLKENGLSVEDIKNIKFEGARVPKEDKNVGYLERVQEFISPRKEESPQLPPKLKNLNAVSQNNEEPPQLLPKKRKSSDGMVADGENKKQDIKGMLSSETQANPTRSKRHAMMLDPQQIESIHQNAEEPPLGKKYAHTETISLSKAFDTIRDFFQDCGQKIINTIHRLLKKEVITGVKEQGYDVNSEKGKSEITIYGNKLIDIDKIKTDFIDTSLIRIMELGEEKIKDLNNNYKGDQLGREISKLLNAGSQKENINSNYNDGEPIFQTRKEALNYPPQKKDINSNSVRGNYNGGEPTHQTVQEARNYHRQKKGIDSNPVSKKPLAPPVPPKNYTEKVTQSRNAGGIKIGK
ncbi:MULTISPECIES: hypothetical protein [Wolbachia]|uniref:hypothetical protein n=1 Tax=Wolbachia TaxID=953 RepID=UPI0001986522|nr:MULTISPECIES: hypothetical protein [Wolbachia]MDX5487304.1 hypothetical protein [Wolbachia endosymbiont of Andrena praecox]MDX5497617.1 hypothetical protein [Wolbachia endosymbiont of Lasioglossum nitidulum]MDX5562180.1 hypothetical protein [Wolbachia endosymbiont of Andrena bicolor]MDX5596263.1 hypothetical protein [Wolbachia endosymbiont of Andrena labialis]ACN95489.1 hypothetical protein WRi_007390 [Wolbachia sp. wRi]